MTHATDLMRIAGKQAISASEYRRPDLRDQLRVQHVRLQQAKEDIERAIDLVEYHFAEITN